MSPREIPGRAARRGLWLGLVLVAAASCRTVTEPLSPTSKRELSPARVETLVREADELYGEPRTVERVSRAVELCVAASVPGDPQGALWRAARACAWLAQYHPEKGSRRAFAEQGVQAAERSLERTPEHPAPYFYHALTLGILSDITGSGLTRISTMKESALRVIELDERYSYAGGHRFLGILMYRTSMLPFFAAGTAEDGRSHLERAVSLFPDYGRNPLALAEYHVWNGQPEEARRYLEDVVRSAPPPDETAEHAEWVARARELLAAKADATR